MKVPKISIIGAGRVGSTTAHLCALKQLGGVALIDLNAGLAQGIALDLSESAPIEGFHLSIQGGDDYHLTAKSDVVVITAGFPRKPGMSRDDLLEKNASIVKSVSKEVAAASPEAKIIVVTNPLDAMAYVALKTTRFPKERVLGMAGTLDSSRFRSFISAVLDVPGNRINALVLGSHGDEMVPVVSEATVEGKPLPQLMEDEQVKPIVERTRNAGAEIVALEKIGSAFYAPASSVVEMVDAILNDRKKILPCSAYLEGEYGAKDIFMGIPAVLGEKGIEQIKILNLSAAEEKALQHSIASIQQTTESAKKYL